jgi:hypothetical protein
MKFEVKKDVYNPDFVAKVQESRQQAKEGKVTWIKKEELKIPKLVMRWGINCILPIRQRMTLLHIEKQEIKPFSKNYLFC